jgi:hypothetical protein
LLLLSPLIAQNAVHFETSIKPLDGRTQVVVVVTGVPRSLSIPGAVDRETLVSSTYSQKEPKFEMNCEVARRNQARIGAMKNRRHRE